MTKEFTHLHEISGEEPPLSRLPNQVSMALAVDEEMMQQSSRQRREASMLLLEAPTSFATVADLVELIYEFVGLGTQLVHISGVNRLWRGLAFGQDALEEAENSTTNTENKQKEDNLYGLRPIARAGAGGFFKDYPELLNGFHLTRLLDSFESSGGHHKSTRSVGDDFGGSGDEALLSCLEHENYPTAYVEQQQPIRSKCIELLQAVVALLVLAAPSVISVLVCSYQTRCEINAVAMLVLFATLAAGGFSIALLCCAGLTTRSSAGKKNARFVLVSIISVVATSLTVLGVYLAVNGGFPAPSTLLEAVKDDYTLGSAGNCLVIENPHQWVLGEFSEIRRARSRDEDRNSYTPDIRAYLTLTNVTSSSPPSAVGDHPDSTTDYLSLMKVPVLFTEDETKIARLKELSGTLSSDEHDKLIVRVFHNNDTFSGGLDFRPVGYLKANLINSQSVYKKNRIGFENSYCLHHHRAAVGSFVTLWLVVLVLFIAAFWPIISVLMYHGLSNCRNQSSLDREEGWVDGGDDFGAQPTPSTSIEAASSHHQQSRRPIVTYSWYESLAVTQRLTVAKGSRARLQRLRYNKGNDPTSAPTRLEQMRLNMIAQQQQREDPAATSVSSTSAERQNDSPAAPSRFSFNYSPEVRQKLTLAQMRAAAAVPSSK